MPLPTRNKDEQRKDFISRCMSELTRKGEGQDASQRAAICNSQASSLDNGEATAISNLWQRANIASKPASCCQSCAEISEDSCGSTELFATAEENKKPPRPLNKPFRTPKGPKKFSVYVRNDKGNIVKVNFGDPNMEIKRDDPDRRRNFRARHNCDSPGPKWKARYWSCKFWEKDAPVSKLTGSQIICTSYVSGHTHDIPLGTDEGLTSFDHGHQHVFKKNPDGSYTISSEYGHTHKIAAPNPPAGL